MQSWKIGSVKITQVVESTFEGLEDFLPQATPDKVLPIEWLKPFLTPKGDLKFSIHALIVETRDKRIIVDTCVGNDKPRDFFPDWHMLQTDFLEEMERAGFGRETFDTVLCTHLHLDHVGWNTMLVDGEWVPTFPNARYLIEKSEFGHTQDSTGNQDIEPWLRDMNEAVMADSVRPVVEAGLVELVGPDHRICDEVSLIPTPGHTIGHVSVKIESEGESGLITGDFVHHPCQLVYPEWSVTTDYDPEQSTTTRSQVFQELSGTETLVIGTHWPEPTAGKIKSGKRAFKLEY